MSRPLPSLPEAKAAARRLRHEAAARGMSLGHARALELVAHRYGFRDWNALHAVIADRPPAGWVPGGRVCGQYLSQRFEASVLAVERVAPGWYRLELELDQAVDVVTSAHFSNHRKRLRGIVGPKGHSAERTGNGEPQLRIDL